MPSSESIASPDDLIHRAETLAVSLLDDAAARRRRAERRQANRLARILGDPAGRSAVLALTDEVLRVRDPRRAAALLAGLVRTGRSPLDDWRSGRYLTLRDRVAFVGGGRLAPWLPRVVMPLARRRVRAEMSGVIVPASAHRLARHVQQRRRLGIGLIINVLGEYVLGEDEARRRLRAVIDVLGRPEVDYVSVKISSISSQLDVLAFDEEVDRIATRLRPLYRKAQAYSPPKFVNLDMEEYQDLDLTTAVFRKVLDEGEFLGLSAGIVLQAYLPDSLAALEDLVGWARLRHESGGGAVKVRIVKGANLAMETVDAEIRGWDQAPFLTKNQTDANYKRMLEVALAPDLEGAVRVGVASHNLFEVAWAAVCAEAAGAHDRVEFEMLEGMSPAVARAAAARFGHLLLYAPIVDDDNIEAAIAYLVRRLDENSSPDNFLARQFDMTPGSEAWALQAGLFRQAVATSRASDHATTRRLQNRVVEDPDGRTGRFTNEADTDFTRLANRQWAWAHVRRATAGGLGEYRPVVAGVATEGTADQAGVDPGHPETAAYRWVAASEETVQSAIAAARAGQDSWWGLGAEGRRALLQRVAAGLARDRGRLLATMAVDGGKTVREGDLEVSEAVDFARYYAEHIPSDGSGFAAYGTVAVVSPWNFPLSIPAGGVLAALAAGNTVILKPAPETVAVAGELVRVLWAAGVPETALQFLPCVDGPASQRLVMSPGVDAVILTGSWDTARMFLEWRPSLDLHAETSGKNAIVVTATADPDQAIADLLRSAFGHAGQKCSAASSAILEASVYDDGRFLRRLADAARSLRVGPADRPGVVMGPLIRPPEGPLAVALGGLEPGESWLVRPERLDEEGFLWSPGVKIGVEPGSPFHLTECFGPVLGVMRAEDIDEALAWQNQPAFGLTAGIQALDPVEIEHWRGRAESGNLYVNRATTGAIVGRQPFGGWKHSVVGPGAKAGGPNYVASLGSWPAPRNPATGPPSHAAFEAAWRELARPSDPTGLRAEANVLRYRPLRRVSVVGSDPGPATLMAAAAAGVEVETVPSPDRAAASDKLRLVGPLDDAVLRAAHATGTWVDTTPVAADPARELLRWVREQAVSESRHRHGNVTGRRPGLLPPPGP